MLGKGFPHRPPQRPGADAVDDHGAVEPGEQGVVEVGVQPLERSLDALAVKVERRRDA